MTWLWGQFHTAPGRRALAFFALLGGAVVLTLYAVWALWLVRSEAEYAFGLGLAAHGGLAIILSGFVALFVKRNIKLSRDGIEVSDQPDAAQAAVAVADAAVEKADEIVEQAP